MPLSQVFHLFPQLLDRCLVQDQPPPQTERRESLLVPLDARIRDMRQAPDGTIYIAVERDTQLGPGSTKLTPTGSIMRLTPSQ